MYLEKFFRPHQFDVMIMTNLYGTIVSNVVCGLVGGAGLLSGRNYGNHYAVFEPGTRNTGTKNYFIFLFESVNNVSKL